MATSGGELSGLSRHWRTVGRKRLQYRNVTAQIFISKAAATLEPEPTQHSKLTSVWAYIARHAWLLIIRHVRPDLPLISLLIVSDANGTRCTCLMVTGTNFCWQIVTFAWSEQTDEENGWISYGNQKLTENVLNQRFSTFVKTRPAKFFFSARRGPGPNKFTRK
jgi:hypothetical protein